MSIETCMMRTPRDGAFGTGIRARWPRPQDAPLGRPLWAGPSSSEASNSRAAPPTPISLPCEAPPQWMSQGPDEDEYTPLPGVLESFKRVAAQFGARARARGASRPSRTCRLEDVCPQAIAWPRAAFDEVSDAEDTEGADEEASEKASEGEEGADEESEWDPVEEEPSPRSCSPALPTPESMGTGVRLGKRRRAVEEDDDAASADEARRKKKRDARFPCLFEDCTETIAGDKERQRHMSGHFRRRGTRWRVRCPNYAVCGKDFSRGDEVPRHLRKAAACRAAAARRPGGEVDDPWRDSAALPYLRAPPSGDPLAGVLRELWERHGLEPYVAERED